MTHSRNTTMIRVIQFSQSHTNRFKDSFLFYILVHRSSMCTFYFASTKFHCKEQERIMFVFTRAIKAACIDTEIHTHGSDSDVKEIHPIVKIYRYGRQISIMYVNSNWLILSHTFTSDNHCWTFAIMNFWQSHLLNVFTLSLFRTEYFNLSNNWWFNCVNFFSNSCFHLANRKFRQVSRQWRILFYCSIPHTNSSWFV